MTTIMSDTWANKNQQYLVACIEKTKSLIKDYISKKDGRDDESEPRWDDDSTRPAIEHLCSLFGLSSFEKSVLLMCAAAELDSDASQLYASANGNQNAGYPTFSLALAVFPDAHWSALSPVSSLRRFRLVDLIGLPQVPVTRCQLQIEERILHYLTGISYLERSLHGMMEPARGRVPVSDSQKAVAQEMIHAWECGGLLHVQLVGPDDASRKAVAGLVCDKLGVNLWQVAGELLPSGPDELEPLTQLWVRESALLNAALYIEASDVEAATQKSIRKFIKGITGPIFLSTGEQWPAIDGYFIPAVHVHKPTGPEQREFWRLTLQNASLTKDAQTLEDGISRLVNQFNLNYESIQSAASEALLAASRGEKLQNALWAASQQVALPRLLELAQRVTSRARMDDLVLPRKEKQLIGSIIANVRQRYKVYEEWGFGRAGDRGLGITALFSGDSGTGKTMAAEVIASELKLDLFKIDLSMVVNKYIGETEKNLRRIFDAAEDGGAILFFDEADALFGKRSEVRDSHDRYANMEVGYLLQRMDAYRGLAILTTNMKNALDRAFMRRIRFMVDFPFPDEKSRKEIWKKVFPSSLPVSKLDFDKLAQLEVTGGHIHNIALGASFLAADEGVPVHLGHIARATKEEYDKMDRPMPGGMLT